MKQLLLSTTAYCTFSHDVESCRLSHAYMLYLNDIKSLKSALKIFALKFFNLSEEDADGKRLLKENLVDCRIYPDEGKKLNAEAIAELLSDSALRPLEYDKKLYIISGFNEASALLQNKLLKILEEPPAGVYFLLGVTTLAPVLDTVKSRVKTLTIPPFSESQIFAALERKGNSPLNMQAAKSCGGIFGVAENMVSGGWFMEITRAAEEICTASSLHMIGAIAIKYGDTKYRQELLNEIHLLYYTALSERTKGKQLGTVASTWLTPTLVYAIERVNKAGADLKFNAFFQGLLYDLMLGIIEENDKWLKLQA